MPIISFHILFGVSPILTITYLSFSKEFMIIIKASTNAENQTCKIQRTRAPKIPTQQLYSPYEHNMPPQQINNKTELLKTLQNNTHNDDEEKSKPTLKLPLINKKGCQTPAQSYDLVDKRQQQGQAEEIKALSAHPYIRKYVDRRSTDKLKSQGSCNFLSIVGVRPGIRSSSRMSTKDANTLLGIQKFEKPDKFMPLIDIENKHQEQNQVPLGEYKTKPRRTSIKCKSSTAQKIESLSRPKQRTSQQTTSQKKKLRIQKPKQSPNYFQWCFFLGLLDGVTSGKESSATYKAFVGKGNNSILVKTIIKARPWWTLCQQDTEANLSWTQSREPKFLQTLKQGPSKSQLEWANILKAKMQLFGSLQWGLSDKTKDCIGLGFHKVLTKSEQQTLCKSQSAVQLFYPREIRNLQALKLRSHNHLQFNWNLSNKKALYYNMKAYYIATAKDPFEYIPETYHVQKEGDDEWNNFLKGYENKGLWIIKPGQNSNRGCGINVVETLDQVREIVRNKSVRANGKPRSHIIQRYLMPYLYNRRKFDMRCYMLVTSINGNLRCYWYEQGYVRTASKEFTTKNLKNRMIHLTNDAVQKHSENYGKHESGNKLSFADFHKYVKNTDPELDFFQHSYPKMVQLAADAIRSTYSVIDAKHRQFSFQIFGLDFMIDENFKTWLIEVNTNPCLELSCPLLARIIPSMLENAFRIAIDPLYPPPKDFPKHKGLLQQLFQGNKFSLVFSGRQQQQLTKVLPANRLQDIDESEQQSACEDEQ